MQGGFQTGFIQSSQNDGGVPVQGAKAVLSQRQHGLDIVTMADTNDYRRNRSSTSCKVTVNEMIESNMKDYFNK